MRQKEVFLKELARQIQIARTEAGKSQMDVLEELHIHVGRIEMGRQSITVGTLLELCRYLDIGVSDLLKRVENRKSPTYRGR